MKKWLVLALVLVVMLFASASAEKGVLTLPEDTRFIDHYAFKGVKGFSKVVLPDGVKSIGNYVFQNSSLKEINIPSSVTFIYPQAFDFCDIDLVIVTSGSYGERYCKEHNMKYRVVLREADVSVKSLGNNQCEITACTSEAAEIIVPEYIGGKQVVSIGPRVFYENSYVKRVELPASVTKISEWAFYYSRLESINLENVTTIERGAFHSSNLVSVVLNEKITALEASVFGYCSELEEIVLPPNLKTIGAYAFDNCLSLQYVVIPETVTSIGDSAFFYCRSLQLVVLPKSIQTIGDKAFQFDDAAIFITERNCAALEYCKENELIFLLEPNAEKDFTVTKLSSTTCKITGYKGSATDVFLPETIGGRTVTQIGADAFRGNTKIKSVSILNSVTSIGRKAFYGCKNLSCVQIAGSVTNIDETAFDNCSKLEYLLVVDVVDAASME